MAELTLDQQKAIALASARARAAESAASSSQPSFSQSLMSSPVGRFAHDALLPIVEGPARLLSKIDPTGGMVGPMLDKGEKSYQDALAASRNTPGYAAARSQADAIQAGKGSGLTDQVIAPFVPSLAGATGGLFGGSMDAANASADAATDALKGYQTANPVSSTIAQVGGGFLGAPGGGAPSIINATAREVAPSIVDLRAAAKAAYKKVDDSGVKVSTDSLNGMADSLEDKLSERLDPTLHPEATAAYNRVLKFKTDQDKAVGPASFTQLDNLRRVVADAGNSIKPADRALARQIQDHVDDYVGNLTSADLDTSALDEARSALTSATGAKGQTAKQIKSIEVNKPGSLAARGAAGADTRAQYMALHEQLPQLEAQRQAALGDFNTENAQITAGPQDTIDALNSARDLWARSSKAQTLQNIIDKAKNNSTGFAQSGYENALRSGFRKLLNNDRGISRFSPPEVAAIKQVATGGSSLSATNLLRQVGKLSPQGAVPILAEIGLYGGLGPAALAAPAAGIAGRTGATILQKAAAKRAVDLAAMGRGAAIPLRNPPLQLPQLTSRSAIPLGLFGSSYATQNQ